MYNMYTESHQVFFRQSGFQAQFKEKQNKRVSRTAMFSVIVADRKLVEQTTNHFFKIAKNGQKQLARDLVEKSPAYCSRHCYVLKST